MILSIKKILTDLINKEFKTRHLEKKVTACVVEADKLNKKMKDAITKTKDAKFLKDADYIIGFCEVTEGGNAEKEEDNAEEQNNDNNTEDTKNTTDDKDTEEVKDTDSTADDTEKEEENKDTTDDSSNDKDTEEDASEDKTEDNADDKNDDADTETEDTEKDDAAEEENNDDKKKKDKPSFGVNESVKVEDLTKTMLLTPKKPSNKNCSCGGNCKKSNTKKCDCKKNDTKKVNEAETEASGDELKAKVAKMVNDMFNTTDSNKAELIDVPDFADNANVYFVKLSIKDDTELVKQNAETKEVQ